MMPAFVPVISTFSAFPTTFSGSILFLSQEEQTEIGSAEPGENTAVDMNCSAFT